LATEKFHFALRATFGYSELDNKADTATLHESLHNTSWAPGVEFRLYSLLAGFEYQNNKSTIEMSGSSSHDLHTSFYSPRVFLGFDIPMDWWGFRLYYTRSDGDVPHFDSGLTSDSPWKQEQILIAFRFNFRHGSSSASAVSAYPSYNVESQPVSRGESNGENSRLYRPVRYFPRPSRNLGN
jgi:hypothetical protein